MYGLVALFFQGMIPAMISCMDMMLERWKVQEEKELEVSEEFLLLTSKVISKRAFGTSYTEGRHIFEMLMRLVFSASRNSLKLGF